MFLPEHSSIEKDCKYLNEITDILKSNYTLLFSPFSYSDYSYPLKQDIIDLLYRYISVDEICDIVDKNGIKIKQAIHINYFYIENNEIEIRQYVECNQKYRVIGYLFSFLSINKRLIESRKKIIIPIFEKIFNFALGKIEKEFLPLKGKMIKSETNLIKDIIEKIILPYLYFEE